MKTRWQRLGLEVALAATASFCIASCATHSKESHLRVKDHHFAPVFYEETAPRQEPEPHGKDFDDSFDQRVPGSGFPGDGNKNGSGGTRNPSMVPNPILDSLGLSELDERG